MAYTSVQKYSTLMETEENIICNRNEEVKLERSLIDAAANGNYEKILELLNSGVTVDAVEYNKLLFYSRKNYVTPLQMAAANGHHDCVKLLIDNHAKVNARDRFDVTALHMAAEKGNYHCVKALIVAGANCLAQTKRKPEYYKAMIYPKGTTPLHLAAANNHADCLTELIQHCQDCNVTDEHNHTSLIIASKNGYRECVLAHFKDVGINVLSIPCNETWDTPLHFTVSHSMIDCVRELLSRGSDVNHLNIMGFSPIHLALKANNKKSTEHFELVKLLILEGLNANINCPDGEGFIPLHYVCFNRQSVWLRRPELAKFLISYGADISITYSTGFNVLEHELQYSDDNYDILKHVIKCMPLLPRLKSLNVHRREDYEAIQRDRNRAEMRTRMRVGMYPRMAAHQPLLMRVRHAQHEVPRERNPLAVQAYYEHVGNLNQSTISQKQRWYEEIASKPRSLKHHCRCIIRRCMGPKKLKYITQMPLPPPIQSYLLLEMEENFQE